MKTKILILLLAAFSLIGCSSKDIPEFTYSYNNYYEYDLGKVAEHDGSITKVEYPGGNTLLLYSEYKDGRRSETYVIHITKICPIKFNGENPDMTPNVSWIQDWDIPARNTARRNGTYYVEGTREYKDGSTGTVRWYITKDRTYTFTKTVLRDQAPVGVFLNL